MGRLAFGITVALRHSKKPCPDIRATNTWQRRYGSWPRIRWPRSGCAHAPLEEKIGSGFSRWRSWLPPWSAAVTAGSRCVRCMSDLPPPSAAPARTAAAVRAQAPDRRRSSRTPTWHRSVHQAELPPPLLKVRKATLRRPHPQRFRSCLQHREPVRAPWKAHPRSTRRPRRPRSTTSPGTRLHRRPVHAARSRRPRLSLRTIYPL